jgi:hypothetical protein
MGSQPVQELLNAYHTLEDQAIFLEYGPHGNPKQTFEGIIKEGIEVDGKVYSPSCATVYCIQEAGSPRKTPILIDSNPGGTRRTHRF